MHTYAVIVSPQKSPKFKGVYMRDLNKVAEKLDGLWNTGKMNKPVKPKPAMNTTEKIYKVMAKLDKKGK